MLQILSVPSSARFTDQYQQIFFACHTRHTRDPRTKRPVSARQMSILGHLDRVAPVALAKLASHMGVTPSTMSLAIDRLERLGYVARGRDARDGRVRHIRITPAGERLRGAESVLDPVLVQSLLARLRPIERRAALTGLALLARAAGELVEAGGQKRSDDRPHHPT